MLETILKSVRLIQSKTRWRLYVLPLVIFLCSVLDAVGIAAVFPFIKVLVDPGSVQSIPYLAAGLEFFGFDPNHRPVEALALGLIVFFVFKNLFLIYANYWKNNFTNLCQADLSASLLTGYLRMPFTFHLEKNRAELLRNINNSVPVVFKSVFLSTVDVCIEIATAVVIFATLIIISPNVTLTVGIIVGGMFAAFTFVLPKIMGYFGRQAHTFNEAIMRAVLQALGGVKEISVLGREFEFETIFKNTAVQYARVKTITNTLQNLPRHLTEVVLIVALVGAVFLILDSGASSNDLIATLSMFGAAAFRIVPSFNRTIVAVSNISFGKVAVDTVWEDVRRFRPTSTTELQDSAPPLRLRDALALKDVDYTYPGAGLASLHDINLAIAMGQSVGVVGRSGAGKTTLVNVFLGLLAPTSGTFSVDGINVVSENVRRWRKNIGYVAQDIFLTDDTLRRNIALGVPSHEIDDARIHTALETAQLTDLVKSLDNGLETIVGEDGVRLSGGQRQRIGIARALYHDPEVLIFDEATSALDTDTEAQITQTLESLHGQKTLIVVAHRISTVQRCDFLVFMDRGKIVEMNTYQALYQNNADFRRMIDVDFAEADSSMAKEEQSDATAEVAGNG